MTQQDPQTEKDLLVEAFQTCGLPSPASGSDLFALLGVPRDCEDDQLINKRGRQLVKALGKWEQYRQNPKVQKMATALMSKISGAQRRLRSVEGRQAYRKEQAEQQAGGFRREIQSLITPASTLDDAHVDQLLQLARKRFGLDRNTALKIIKELSHNPFAALGIQPAPEDPSWPTAFDILTCEEGQARPGQVRTSAEAQLQKIDVALQRNSISPDEANRLSLYVEEARITLSSEELARAYLQGLVGQRLTRFGEIVTLALKSGRQDSNLLIRLVHQGRKMRLSQKQIEQVMQKVARVSISDLVGGGQPVLRVNLTRLETFVSGDGSGGTQMLTISNEGTGVLEVTVEPSHSWIAVSENHFKIQTHRDVTITISPYRLVPSTPLSGTLSIQSNGGNREIEVIAVLGQPGPLLTQEDYQVAGGYYKFTGFWWWTLLPFSILPWRFITTRRSCTFLAFHALQALAVGTLCVLFLVAFVLYTARLESAEPSCFSVCLIPLLLLSLTFGLPLGMWKAINQGRNIQIPGVGTLLKRLL